MKNLLVEIAKGELKVEAYRQSLASLDTKVGGAYVCFQRIDRDREECVTPRSILAFLNDNRVFDVSLIELDYIVRYFDSDGNGRLSYSE